MFLSNTRLHFTENTRTKSDKDPHSLPNVSTQINDLILGFKTRHPSSVETFLTPSIEALHLLYGKEVFLRLAVRWNDLLKGTFFASFRLFFTLIINPWLVILKSVSSAKLSILTPSSLAALQILTVSHLFCLLLNHVEQQPLLPRINPPLSLSVSSLFLRLLSSLRAVHEGDWCCPFTSQCTSVLCKWGTAGCVGF